MGWKVRFSGKVEKQLKALREPEQRKARALTTAIEAMAQCRVGGQTILSLGTISTTAI